MLGRVSTRTLPIVNRAVELTPTAQACCGVCRTCATTNILSVALAGIAGLAVGGRRLARRFAR
jgi:hypothetical protein